MSILHIPSPPPITQARYVIGYCSIREIPVLVTPGKPKQPGKASGWKHGPNSLKTLATIRNRKMVVDAIRDFGRRVKPLQIRVRLNCMSESALREHLKVLRESGEIKCDPPAFIFSNDREYWVTT